MQQVIDFHTLVWISILIHIRYCTLACQVHSYGSPHLLYVLAFLRQSGACSYGSPHLLYVLAFLRQSGACSYGSPHLLYVLAFLRQSGACSYGSPHLLYVLAFLRQSGACSYGSPPSPVCVSLPQGHVVMDHPISCMC